MCRLADFVVAVGADHLERQVFGKHGMAPSRLEPDKNIT
jgi:hypothetical protein